MKHLISVFALVIVAMGTVTAQGDLLEVEGVFGVEPVNSTTAFAIWVPLDDGEAIDGVTWYNSDGQITFPELRAVAGDPGQPELLAQAVTVASSFQGFTQQWSDVQFVQPIASTSSGLYLIFILPEGSDFVESGDGGGAGFGYVSGTGVKHCWITGDGTSWLPLNGEFQIAIEAVMCGNKSGNILVLDKPGGTGRDSVLGEVPLVYVQSIAAVPNPFNPETEIMFTLPASGEVKITVFDVRGRLVRQLMDEALEAGPHSVRWNGKDETGSGVSSGVYMARLVSSGMVMTVRMALVQ